MRKVRQGCRKPVRAAEEKGGGGRGQYEEERGINRRPCCPINPKWRPWNKFAYFQVTEGELQKELQKACRLKPLQQLRDNGE